MFIVDWWKRYRIRRDALRARRHTSLLDYLLGPMEKRLKRKVVLIEKRLKKQAADAVSVSVLADMRLDNISRCVEIALRHLDLHGETFTAEDATEDNEKYLREIVDLRQHMSEAAMALRQADPLPFSSHNGETNVRSALDGARTSRCGM